MATTRALLGTPGANNSGFLTAGATTGNVLAATLRPFSVVTQAGATMLDVPQATGDFAIPTVSTAPTGAWLIEGAAATPASVVTGSVSLTPRSAAVVVEVSRQLLKQAPGMTDQLFESELLTTAGKLLDVAAIGGAGGVEPLGLLSCTGIAATAGAALAWSSIVGMRADVLAGGAQESRLMWLADPATQEILAGRERFAGAGEIWRDGRIAGIPAAASSSVPSGTLILGDWASLAVAVWGGVVLERNPYASFASGGESVRVLLAADVAVLRPQAFAIATSVT